MAAIACARLLTLLLGFGDGAASTNLRASSLSLGERVGVRVPLATVAHWKRLRG